MQKDDRFDLALREKLNDAQVPAPSGAWKAISSRLDDIDGVPVARREPSRGWIWLGGALAAAALAMALVLTGTFQQHPEQQLAKVEEASIAPVATPEPVTIEELSSPELSRQDASVRFEIANKRQDVDEPDRNVAVEPSSQNKAPEQLSTPKPEVAKPSPAPKTEEQKLPSIRDAEFVVPEAEKVRKNGFGSYISGAVSANSASNRQTSYSSGTAGAASSNYILETGSSVYGIPFSIGVGARYHFNEKISLSAGLDYSLLTRSFAGTYLPEGAAAPVQGDAHHYVHYLGIPVNVYYNFLETSLLRFYGFAGGEVEFCLASDYRFNAAGADYYLSEKVTNPLFSIRMGVGIEFKVSKLVGIYLDPGAYYCFYSGQPKSLRTERPFNFNFNAGVRFNFQPAKR